MSPNDTNLRAFSMPGSTADIKEMVHIRSNATTNPNDRQKKWNRIEKLFKQWQTRGLIPADDQPGPTEAHRTAVVEYENAEYLQQQEAWVKAGRPPWYGPAKSAMKKAEKRKAIVTSLLIHLTYTSQGLTNSIHVVNTEITEEAPVIQTPKQYPSLTEVSPPDISENNRFHQASIQAPNVKELGYKLEEELNRRMEELSRRMEAELIRRMEELKRQEHRKRWEKEQEEKNYRTGYSPETTHSTEERRQADEAHNDIMTERKRTEEEYQERMVQRRQEDERFQVMMADRQQRQRREQEEQRTQRWEESQRTHRTNYSPDKDYSKGPTNEDDNDRAHSVTSKHSVYPEPINKRDNGKESNDQEEEGMMAASHVEIVDIWPEIAPLSNIHHNVAPHNT
ncbi:hypothetical protein F7725_001547 [Dissostichus mawsoni]|uniref:Uncharacterized protein n=1 Tax=Dissostichus mawsoni TaxID=36200 RepID=A0A7J5Y2X8_DISMA|nr:hypothetical protein F7725_001547 [Dissostichus mawsoni]